MCENKDCKDCFEKSFASHTKSNFWSNDNILKARQVFKNSNKKFLFNCDKCNHKLNMNISSINKSNNWCVFCANQKLCENENCKNCFEKSFITNPKSKFWSNKNILKPKDVFKSSDKKFIFDCNKCNNEFEISLDNITRNRWCPFCKNKTEGILFTWLKKNYKNIKHQVRFNWCKDKRQLPFDFFLEDYNLFIELDGPQHFKQISNWKNPEETQKIDKFKMECALKNGYSLIRIKQDDVWNNKIDWKSILIKNIKKYDNNCITTLYNI